MCSDVDSLKQLNSTLREENSRLLAEVEDLKTQASKSLKFNYFCPLLC